MSSTQLQSQLFDTLDPKSLGFASWGVSELANPISLEFYKTWLDKKYHGDMKYLEAHLPQKQDPKLLGPSLQSALVFAFSYLPHPFPASPKPELRIAKYVGGKDYHLWLKEKLSAIAEKLQSQFPEHQFLPMTDSTPVLERDLARRAGLGWFGKNTCLLDRENGSLFFIGEILSSLPVSTSAVSDSKSSPIEAPPVKVQADFCGTCTRCIDICPTGALEAPRLLNANKCISYLTIESQELPPENLREKIGDWFFGCDLCQTVCPWNQKVFGKDLASDTVLRLDLSDSKSNSDSESNSNSDLNRLSKTRSQLVSELREFLTLSGKSLQKKYADSPLIRARPFGLKRNAIVVATNQGLSELLPEISSHEADPRLASLVRWSLQRLKG